MPLVRKAFRIDQDFKLKALSLASTHNHCSFLNYNDLEYHFGSFPCMLAFDAMEEIPFTTDSFNNIKKQHDQNKSWLFGYLGYDLKNELEKLSSANQDLLQLPDLCFFRPRHILHFRKEEVEILTENDPDDLFMQINAFLIPDRIQQSSKITLRQRVSKDRYLKNVNEIKNHLTEGDIYELNYCMEFYAEEIIIDPLQTFLRLNELSPMPFSVFMKFRKQYLISASPERFLKKEKDKLLSQPIKGTSRRGKNSKDDEQLRNKLFLSEKERSENMMIVDLVRNDLSRSSRPGSVKVEELFGIYSFKQVHQMISSVSSHIREGVHFIDAIKNAFPMGSMTGAPKIRAMELIEKYEDSKRGLFSGAAGFISPTGDFDFNVVIRSIIYSEDKQCISFQAGSAITWESDPEKEYEECLLKAETMKKALEDE